VEERTTREMKLALAKGERPPSKTAEVLPATKAEQMAGLNQVLKPQKGSDLALDQVSRRRL